MANNGWGFWAPDFSDDQAGDAQPDEDEVEEGDEVEDASRIEQEADRFEAPDSWKPQP